VNGVGLTARSVRRSHCAARHTPTLNALVGPTQFTPPHQTRQDGPVSCLVCQCELDDCCERVQTSNFLSATVLSCRESNSNRRSGRDTDKTVLSCLAWRCELALRLIHSTRTEQVNPVTPSVRLIGHAHSPVQRVIVEHGSLRIDYLDTLQ